MTELLPPPWPPIRACPYLRSAGAIETGPRSSRSSIRSASRSISGGAIARRTVARGEPRRVSRAREAAATASPAPRSRAPRRAARAAGWAARARSGGRRRRRRRSIWRARELVLGAQLGEQAGGAASGRAVAADDAQVEVQSERCWSSSAPLSSLASTTESMPSSPGSRLSACCSDRSRRLSSRRARRCTNPGAGREHELHGGFVVVRRRAARRATR